MSANNMTLLMLFPPFHDCEISPDTHKLRYIENGETHGEGSVTEHDARLWPATHHEALIQMGAVRAPRPLATQRPNTQCDGRNEEESDGWETQDQE